MQWVYETIKKHDVITLDPNNKLLKKCELEYLLKTMILFVLKSDEELIGENGIRGRLLKLVQKLR